MSDLKALTEYIPTQYVVWTTVIVIVLVLAAIKCYPKVKSVFEAARLKANKSDDLFSTLHTNTLDVQKIKQDIDVINQKIDRDYARLNQIQAITVKQQKYIEESLEERELIIRSLLGVVQGLQEVGANGPTKKAEADIQAYLLKKSHEAPSDMEI